LAKKPTKIINKKKKDYKNIDKMRVYNKLSISFDLPVEGLLHAYNVYLESNLKYEQFIKKISNKNFENYSKKDYINKIKKNKKKIEKLKNGNKNLYKNRHLLNLEYHQ